tara:strand:+ start:8869 stop:9237 length:369 start_codon:yes stop_codon:yes gene_type:complete
MAELAKLRKGDLASLAGILGIDGTDGMNKGDLSDAINAMDLSDDNLQAAIDELNADNALDDAGDPDPDGVVLRTDPRTLALVRAAFPDAKFENDIQVRRCLEVMTPSQKEQAQKKLAAANAD